MANLGGRQPQDLRHFQRTGRHGNFLEIGVLRAYNLPTSMEDEEDDAGFSEEYASLEEWYLQVALGGVRKYSTLVRASAAPVWDEKFAFEILDGRVEGKGGEELEKAKLVIEIRETIAGAPSETDRTIGILELDASRLITEYEEGEHNLLEPGGGLLVGDDGLDSLIKLRLRSGVLADNPSSDEASWWRTQAQNYRRDQSQKVKGDLAPRDPLKASQLLDMELQQNRVWMLYKRREELPALELPDLPYIETKDLDRSDPNKDYLAMLRHMGVTKDKLRVLTDWFDKIASFVGEPPKKRITEEDLINALSNFGYHFGVKLFLRSWRKAQESAGVEDDLGDGLYEEIFLRIVAEEEAADVQGLITNIKNPEVDIKALQAEVEESRKGMELMRKYGIIPKDKGNLDPRWIWSQAEGKLAKVTGLKTFAEAEVQADEDPFSQSLYIHYLPSEKRATGLAGEGSGDTDQVKKQQSRVWVTTMSEMVDQSMADQIRLKPKTYEERLQEISKGKQPESIHELSYAGRSFMDAALKPAAWYFRNQPGTAAVVKQERGQDAKDEYSTIKHTGSAHMARIHVPTR